MPPSRRASVDRLALLAVANFSRPSPGDPLLLLPYSLAVGVGQSRIASVSVVPECMTPVVVVPRAAALLSVVTGAGQSAARASVGFPRRKLLPAPRDASDAIGVGKSTCPGSESRARVGPFASLASGVRHEEEAFSSVRRADVGRGDDASVNGVPEAVEIGDNAIQPARNERRDVLNNDDARPELGDDPRVLEPEARACAFQARTLASLGNILAREASANEVHGSKIVPSDMPNVSEASSPRPVSREHRATPAILLHLPHHAPEPGPL